MLRLEIDRTRFDAGLKKVAADFPGLVPVAKGNGYGLGIARLAREAAALGADILAVGTAAEVGQLGGVPFERVVVLTPHLPGDPVSDGANLVHTAAGAAALRDLAGRAVVVECRTSLRRHGVEAGELPAVAEALAGARLEGFALHLPMNRPSGVNPVAEVDEWVGRLAEAGLPTATIWVSHLSAAEVSDLTQRHPASRFRARIGTRLWLGDRGALRARARVLDVEQLKRGERFGYRQRRARAAGHLLVVAGGTAHGIGLAAPRAVAGPVSRAKVAAEAGLATVNMALSPFSWAGRQRWFAEPPHMQVSLLWLPAGVSPPAVGEYLDVDTRMTTTTFDAVVDV
ncbi:MAG TPA: alanine racemase [Sporichthyaceae bacterium]|nr:alanine racemase [Sporichthyaceae bacterium]